jgi:hypothetical protein
MKIFAENQHNLFCRQDDAIDCNTNQSLLLSKNFVESKERLLCSVNSKSVAVAVAAAVAF